MLGTVEAPDGAQLTVADVPGLIEGASDGVGLGHAFLAHLERARLLVHVIDASDGDADARFATIDRELALYGAGLDERPQVVVLNKADLTPGPAPFSVDDPRIVAVHRVSCVTGEGIEGLRRALFTLCPAAPELPDADVELPEFLDYRPAPPARRSFRVLRTDRGFRVVGEVPGRGRARGGAPRRGHPPRRARRDRRRGARVGVSVGVFGGAFDPPHVGHVELARRGIERFALDRLLVRVVEEPGHKDVATDPRVRLLLAELAFAPLDEAEVTLDPFARTVDSLEALGTAGPGVPRRSGRVRGLPGWEEPARVLELARLGVATRPGIDRHEARRGARAARPARPGHVLRDRAASRLVVRHPLARLAAGTPIRGLVPAAVEAEIARLELYRRVDRQGAGGMLSDDPIEGTTPT